MENETFVLQNFDEPRARNSPIDAITEKNEMKIRSNAAVVDSLPVEWAAL